MQSDDERLGSVDFTDTKAVTKYVHDFLVAQQRLEHVQSGLSRDSDLKTTVESSISGLEKAAKADDPAIHIFAAKKALETIEKIANVNKDPDVDMFFNQARAIQRKINSVTEKEHGKFTRARYDAARIPLAPKAIKPADIKFENPEAVRIGVLQFLSGAGEKKYPQTSILKTGRFKKGIEIETENSIPKDLLTQLERAGQELSPIAIMENPSDYLSTIKYALDNIVRNYEGSPHPVINEINDIRNSIESITEANLPKAPKEAPTPKTQKTEGAKTKGVSTKAFGKKITLWAADHEETLLDQCCEALKNAKEHFKDTSRYTKADLETQETMLEEFDDMLKFADKLNDQDIQSVDDFNNAVTKHVNSNANTFPNLAGHDADQIVPQATANISSPSPSTDST